MMLISTCIIHIDAKTILEFPFTNKIIAAIFFPRARGPPILSILNIIAPNIWLCLGNRIIAIAGNTHQWIPGLI